MTVPAPLDPGFYDAELRRHDVHLRAAVAVGPGDHVLDVGCGGGRTTLDAARAAADGGSATGVDLAAPMLDHARRVAEAEGVHNVTFELGDAQTHPFGTAHFDVCLSRFGTMFFADPVAAFTNIAGALRPNGRLVLLVWREAPHNEWFTAPRDAIAGASPPAPEPGRLVPFSLGDPATVRRVLGAAGFAGIELEPIDEPVFYGATADAALDVLLRLRHVGDLLTDLDPTAAAAAHDRLRAMVARHRTDDGVVFASAAWLVTALRRTPGRRARPRPLAGPVSRRRARRTPEA
ncbi:MAG: class I SAM-dependent methyltransferase [Actinomycetota bacterium]|nr:class I SAM-dependent methyltransferase [Actinomycetota bacterium]